MKRDALEIVQILLMTACAIAFVAVSASGQTITAEQERQIAAEHDAFVWELAAKGIPDASSGPIGGPSSPQPGADWRRYYREIHGKEWEPTRIVQLASDTRTYTNGIAQAAAPGPPSLVRTDAAAPVSGEQVQTLLDRMTALEVRVAMLAARMPTQQATERTPDQQRTEADYQQQMIDFYDKLYARQLALYEKSKQPTLAQPATKDHDCDCGPNCRCVGTCNCRWAGECLGVPDSRVQRSVVTQPRIVTYSQPTRTYAEPVRYYSRSYSNGSVGGYGGRASSYYGNGYSSSSYGSAVYCTDQYGNPVPCN